MMWLVRLALRRPLSVAVMALLMMVLVGGKDRSLADFRELARAAGLEVQAAGRQPSGRFVVECRPHRAADHKSSDTAFARTRY